MRFTKNIHFSRNRRWMELVTIGVVKSVERDEICTDVTALETTEVPHNMVSTVSETDGPVASVLSQTLILPALTDQQLPDLMISRTRSLLPSLRCDSSLDGSLDNTDRTDASNNRDGDGVRHVRDPW